MTVATNLVKAGQHPLFDQCIIHKRLQGGEHIRYMCKPLIDSTAVVLSSPHDYILMYEKEAKGTPCEVNEDNIQDYNSEGAAMTLMYDIFAKATAKNDSSIVGQTLY